MTHLNVEFFQPDNKHPSAGRVSSRADVGTRFAPFCGEESRLARAQRKSVTQRAKWFITRSERDCQTARDSPLDRDGLEDVPQATLEHLELGDHRKEAAPQVEVRLQLSRNGVLRVMQREVLQPESCLALLQVLHDL
jgi:hypothetical protein